MKAISLWQPWATLVAQGVKWIETRPKNTNVRGRIAIASTAKSPDFNAASELWATGNGGVERAMNSAMDSGWDDAFPRGCLLGSAVLADCIPMVAEVNPNYPAQLVVSHGNIRIVEHITGLRRSRDVTDQFPFGNFAPGRFAYILKHIVPLTMPLPCKGSQGWWNVEPGASEYIMQTLHGTM